MLKKIQQKLIQAIEIVHIKIFGHEMSDAMRKFIKSLSWSFFGGITAAVVMFGVQVAIARILGPEEFGRYNTVLSFSAGMAALLLLGNDIGTVRYLSDKIYKKQQASILMSSIVILFVQTLFFLVIIGLFVVMMRNSDVDKFFLVVGYIFAVLLAYKTMADGYLRSLGKLKEQGIIRIIDAIVVAIMAIFFIYNIKHIVFSDYIIMLSGGILFFIVTTMFTIRRQLGVPSVKHIKLLVGYNKFIAIGALGGMLISFEKLFIGKFMGLRELGIFSAYYASSQLILSSLVLIFMNAFMPSIIENKKSIRGVIIKLRKIIIIGMPIIVLINIVFIALTIFLFGETYEFKSVLAILFSVSAALNVIFVILIAILRIDMVIYGTAVSIFLAIIIIGIIIIAQDIVVYLLVQIFIYSTLNSIIYLNLNQKYAKK